MSNENTPAETLAEYIKGIKAIKWRTYTKRFQVPLEELQSDGLAVLLIAANEKNVAETGLDDFDRFENMTLEELNEFLGLTDDESE